MNNLENLQIQYEKILSDYLSDQNEHNLYNGQNFIRQVIQKNLTPEEVVSIHKNAMEKICEVSDSVLHACDFLIEMMVHFGLKLKEHQCLIEKQQEIRIEMEIATNIQNLLLKTTVPNPNGLDIGMLSIPIRKMNGDYIHFTHDDENFVSVAVTDVVGKGVPAALCMSMVKYGLDTLEFTNNNPSYVLEVLNRIIEKSVDDSMFVSLFYGRFDLKNDIFTYSSAGHEPALYYDASQQTFYDLESKGLLLGVLPEIKYSQVDLKLKGKDLLIIMSDGVTDFNKVHDFDSREFIKQLVLSYNDLNAQQMCETIYRELQSFKVEDDFSIVIIKKE